MGNIKNFCLLVVLLFGAVSFAQGGAQSLAQYHFLGANEIAGDPNANKLKKIWSTPLSKELVDRSVRKASVGVGQVLAKTLGNSGNNPDLIVPLLNDVLTFESSMDSRQHAGGGTEFALAINLPEDRAKVWSENIAKLTGEKGAAVKGDGYFGWEVKRKGIPSLIRFVRAGKWVVVGSGTGELPLQAGFLKSIKNNGQVEPLPEKTWLQADIDWPRLQKDFPKLNDIALKLARTEIKVSSKNDDLRTTVRAIYPEPLKWKSEKWNIPVGLIRDPIISFTAFQNLTALVKTPEEFNRLGVNPLVGQTFIWAQSDSPFHSHVAHATAVPKKDFDQLANKLPEVYGGVLKARNAGRILLSTNKQEINWTGMPIIVPFIRTTNTANGSFLFGGLFPPLPLKNPPPPELISQISGQKNLIYYDWELTHERLGEWQILSQLLPFSASVPPSQPKTQTKTGTGTNTRTSARSSDVLAQRWIAEVAPSLGNAATEVTLAGSNEVSVVRKSNIGFTGFELLMLSTWLTDSDFRPAAPPAPGSSTKAGK